MTKKLYIFGAGGMAREVADIVRELSQEYQAVGFIDKDSSDKGTVLNDLEILGDLENIDIEGEDNYFSCGFGEVGLKMKVSSEAKKRNLKPATLIHPSVIKTPYVEIGKGCIICAGTILTNNIKIGEYVLINLDVTLGHDVTVGDFTTISPGSHISGRVEIGNDCYIGTGAVILPNVKIGHRVTVGAGAVVTKDVADNSTVVGIPAKPLEKK